LTNVIEHRLLFICFPDVGYYKATLLRFFLPTIQSLTKVPRIPKILFRRT